MKQPPRRPSGHHAAARGTAALVTPVGCLWPCSLGPLVIEYTGGTWHQCVDEEQATGLGRG